MDIPTARPTIEALQGISKICETLPIETDVALTAHLLIIIGFVNAHLEFVNNALNSEAALMEIWEKRLLAIEKQLNPHK